MIDAIVLFQGELAETDYAELATMRKDWDRTMKSEATKREEERARKDESRLKRREKTKTRNDEAEDLGIFEREDVKSDEKSNEEKSEEDQHDEDDDESGEDDERSERPAGLVADPSSNERGDAFDNPASQPTQNEVSEAERPLAVAVVEREEEIREPVVVEDTNTPSESQISQLGEAPSKPRKNKPKKEAEEDDEDDDEDEEEDEEEAARSEKVSQARAAYPSPVLYYYPFPESPAAASLN